LPEIALEMNERKGMATAQRIPDIPYLCVFSSSLFGVSVFFVFFCSGVFSPPSRLCSSHPCCSSFVVLWFPLSLCFLFSSPFVFCSSLSSAPLVLFCLVPTVVFYKAREGLVSRPPEMAGIVEARDRGFRNGIVGIVAVIC